MKNPSFPEKKENIRIFLIDSYQTYREGFRSTIQQAGDMDIIGMVENAAGINEFSEIRKAGLAIVDVDLPDLNGIELCLSLVKRYPALRIVLLCDHEWDIYLVSARQIGAVGVLVRRSSSESLIATIRQASFQPVFTPAQLKRIEHWQHTIGIELKKLKPREWKTLRRLASGLTNNEIADQLGISKGSVEKYVSNLLVKFDLNSRSSLVAYIHNRHLDVLSGLSEQVRLTLLS